MDHDIFLRFMDMLEVLTEPQLRQVSIKVTLKQQMLGRVRAKTGVINSPLFTGHDSDAGLLPDVDD